MPQAAPLISRVQSVKTKGAPSFSEALPRVVGSVASFSHSEGWPAGRGRFSPLEPTIKKGAAAIWACSASDFSPAGAVGDLGNVRNRDSVAGNNEPRPWCGSVAMLPGRLEGVHVKRRQCESAGGACQGGGAWRGDLGRHLSVSAERLPSKCFQQR